MADVQGRLEIPGPSQTALGDGEGQQTMNIRNVITGLAMISTLAAVAALGQTAAAAECEGFPVARGLGSFTVIALEDDPICAGARSLHSGDNNPREIQASLQENPTDNFIFVSTEGTSNGVVVCSVQDGVIDGIDPPEPCDSALPIDGINIDMEFF
jgi:hypothetical protein